MYGAVNRISEVFSARKKYNNMLGIGMTMEVGTRKTFKKR